MSLPGAVLRNKRFVSIPFVFEIRQSGITTKSRIYFCSRSCEVGQKKRICKNERFRDAVLSSRKYFLLDIRYSRIIRAVIANSGIRRKNVCSRKKDTFIQLPEKSFDDQSSQGELSIEKRVENFYRIISPTGEKVKIYETVATSK